MHHLTTHVTEGGTKEGVHPEPVRHVDLEPLLQELEVGGGEGWEEGMDELMRKNQACDFSYRGVSAGVHCTRAFG